MNTVKDFEVSQPPTDGISSLSFSPQADFLAAGSWDNQVRIWEVQPTGNTVGKAMYAHEGPVLCTTWSKDGTKIISGGADKAGRMYDVATGQAQQIAQHDAPIKCVRFVEVGGQQVVVTGSWDKTLKYWDTRTPNPVATVNLPERCYSMDSVQQLLVAATAERHVCIYDLSNPTTPFQTIQSPLKWQTRVISCLIDASGYMLGSIEGRVAIQYIQTKDQTNNFTFRCHRERNNIYAVNDMSVHPTYGTFSTAGSDGLIHIWDKGSKQRLKSFDNVGGTVPCTAFNRNGSIFAYAVSYDWSKGHQNIPAGNPCKIFLHPVLDEDAKPRPAKKR